MGFSLSQQRNDQQETGFYRKYELSFKYKHSIKIKYIKDK